MNGERGNTHHSIVRRALRAVHQNILGREQFGIPWGRGGLSQLHSGLIVLEIHYIRRTWGRNRFELLANYKG